MKLIETLKEEIKTFEEKADIYYQDKKWGKICFKLTALIKAGEICYTTKSHDEETEKIK